MVLDVPFEWTESTDEKKNNADADVSEYDAHPDFIRQRVHKGEDARRVLCRFLQAKQEEQSQLSIIISALSLQIIFIFFNNLCTLQRW